MCVSVCVCDMTNAVEHSWIGRAATLIESDVTVCSQRLSARHFIITFIMWLNLRMSLKQVVSFAFVGSIALTLLLLSCTLKFNEETNEEFTKNSYGLFGTLDLKYTKSRFYWVILCSFSLRFNNLSDVYSYLMTLLMPGQVWIQKNSHHILCPRPITARDCAQHGIRKWSRNGG